MAATQVDLPLYVRAPFNYSVNEQQKDKADLLLDAHSSLAATGQGAAGEKSKKIHLPTELWEMILATSHCVDTCQTHLVFKRSGFYNRDTYYTFSGTLREFQKAADVLFTDYLANSDRGEGDDLPWESGCSGACQVQGHGQVQGQVQGSGQGQVQGHGQDAPCPMERGAVCSSIWQTMEFATEKELKLYESLIPSQYSYHGWYEVINMHSGTSYTGLSIGDTHESIAGQPPSKGAQETCSGCEEVFYLSDKHYFDEDAQRHYCSRGCA